MRIKKKWAMGATALVLAGGSLASMARADVIHNDDVIVQGYLCVGFSCADGENFSLDTLRLKTTNAAIHFDDTSAAASDYAKNDWRLVANDVLANGRNVFKLEDATANHEVFSVEAGARAYALYVEDSGEIGVGTADPQRALHVVASNTPALRLQQTSFVFEPRSWEVAANEFLFFVQNVTANEMPFQISSGAADDALVVNYDSDVGIGTSEPTGPLDISRDGIPFIRLTDRDTGVNWALQNNSSEFRITTPTGPGIEFAVTAEGELEARGPLTLSNDGPNWTALEDSSTGITWNYQNNGGEARITTSANPGIEFALAPNGNLTIQGEIFTAGSCSAGCDRVFEADYDLRSIQEHAKAMWTAGYLPAVGPTAEEGSMNLSQKVGGMLNELEHAHIYIAQLEAQVAGQRAELADQRAELDEQARRNAALEGRLNSLEQYVTATAP